ETVGTSAAGLPADDSSPSTITVTLLDAQGNAVAGKVVSLSQAGASSTITTVSGTTNASGVATFTVKDATVESVDYTATDATDSVTLTHTAGVNFGVGPASASVSTVTASPTSLVADNSTTSTITVTLKDASGHPVAGKAISLDQGPGNSTIATVSGTTDAAGHASFHVKDAVVEGVTYTATDTTDSTTVTQAAAVSFTTGPVSAADSTVTASASPVVADNSTTSTITVTLVDAYGHPVAGKAVSLTQGTGSSTVTTVSGTTNAAGHASFTVKDANVEDVTYTAHDTTDSV